MGTEPEPESLWQYRDDDVLAAILRAERVRRASDARALALLGEAQRRGLAGAKGYASTQHLLCDLVNVSRGEANRRVERARAVTAKSGMAGADTGPALPAAGSALAEGAISAEHVDVIASFRASLPRTVTAEDWDPAEKILADLARSVDPAALRRFADRQLRERLDPDGCLPTVRDEARPKRRLQLHRRSDGAGWGEFELDAEPFNQFEALVSSLSAPTPTTTGEPDTRGVDTRRGDALADIISLAAASAERPAEGGDKPQLTVTMSWDALSPGESGQRPVTAGLLGPDRLPIPVSVARRLACDAHVIPAVLGSRGEVLDIGRSTRTIPAAIRRAVVLRDGGCGFPSCERPPAWCDCHHVRHWADGGATSVDNLALLCNQHHRTVHHTEWNIRIDDHGRPEFIPPPWLDPQQLPRHNSLHQRE